MNKILSYRQVLNALERSIVTVDVIARYSFEEKPRWSRKEAFKLRKDLNQLQEYLLSNMEKLK